MFSPGYRIVLFTLTFRVQAGGAVGCGRSQSLTGHPSGSSRMCEVVMQVFKDLLTANLGIATGGLVFSPGHQCHGGRKLRVNYQARERQAIEQLTEIGGMVNWSEIARKQNDVPFQF